MKSRQSPIDIKKSNKKITSNNILKIDYLDKNIVYQSVFKDGNLIYYPNSNNYLTFNDTRFKLEQFHFHNPSEHKLDSQTYDMEIHFVHRFENSYLVLAFFIKKGKIGPFDIALNSNNNANLLEEIGIYTYEDTKPLSEIFNDIAKKENSNKSINHKSSKKQLIEYFREIVENYDEERVYTSDIKKVIQWYNILHENGLIKEQKK